MKKLAFLLIISFFFSINLLFSNGVIIKDASNSTYFKLLTSETSVTVYDQIAIVVTTQKFLNNTGEDAVIKYAYPLAEDASGTNLRWNLGGVWYSADISPSPQDTTLPGGGDPNPNLTEYLGDTPLYFDLDDEISNDSIIIVELTYVQLLPYEFYQVDLFIPNDYSLIQNEILDYQHIDFYLESQRTITNLQLTSHSPDEIYFNDSIAEFEYEIYESQANTDYEAYYELSPEDLGLFSYSTYITDTAFDCDNFGNGFFTFIVEPDPQSEIIDKVFTLIIDKSGSMSGNKILQAKDAASYIVNHLNEGDQFNIVDFETGVNSLFNDHMEFNTATQNQALNYINEIYAGGSTNISGAFSTAIPDFALNDTSVANIIVFFTDGEATAGLTSTDEILEHIQNLITVNEISNLQIHTFGIGDHTNEALLSQIASQNNGLSEFLEDNELEEMITSFYLKIRNPVLLNTEITVDPPILTEIYPNPLENLYLGQQLIVVGRYEEASQVDVTFSGESFGQPISYQYSINLEDTTIDTYQFLTKLWAKEKMENLMVLYYTFDENSPEAEEIRNEIIEISICYNVISPFTSYTGGGGAVFIEEEINNEEEINKYVKAYPNPFSNEISLEFTINEMLYEPVTIQIIDIFGKVINEFQLEITGPGMYSINWDGTNMLNQKVRAGNYFVVIYAGNQTHTKRITKY